MEDLGITVAISADDADFDKKVSAVNKEITALKQSAGRLKKELKLDPSNLEIMKKRASELAKALEKAKVVYKAWNDFRDKQLADGVNTEELRKTEQQLNKAHDRVLSLQIAWEKAEADIENATDSTKKFADAMDKVSKTSGKIASAFKPFSDIAQGAFKTIAQEAIDFEDAFADVEKTVSSTGSAFQDNLMFAGLKEDVKDLSSYLPQTASDIAKLMGLAGQMNVPADQLKDFTESMIMFGDATNITAEEAITDISQIYNVIGKGGDFSDLNNLLSAIVELGNNSATTEKDITTMFKNISAGASRVGMTTDQMVALSATLSSLGLDKGGASAISKIMTNIDMAVTKGGADLQEWANIAGMSGKQFAEAWGSDSADTLLQIVSSMSEMTDEGISMNKILSDLDIKELRQVDTLSRLVNAHDEYAKNIGLASNAYQKGSALEEEASKRYETLASQIQILKNNFSLFALSLGEMLMPYMRDLVDWLMKLADWLNKLSPKTKGMIVTLVGIIAIIAPLFTWIQKITGGLSLLAQGVSFLKGFLAPLFTLITNFIAGPLANIIIFAMNHPILLAITALIAIGKILYDHCEAFREIIDNIWEGLKELWVIMRDDAIELLGIGLGKLGEAFDWVIGKIQGIIGWLGKAMSAIGEFFGLSSGLGGTLGVARQLATGGGWSVINSGGFGAIQSGGFASGGITLNANFSVSSNNITRNDVRAWSEWLADDINEALGRRI